MSKLPITTPLLSICVATYNRANYLEECLQSIKIQIENSSLNNEVEIVVSDNASTDNTAEIVKKYKNHFKNFIFIENKKNLGVDVNTVTVIKNATGKYSWLFADDDLIVNGAIETVFNKLKKDEYDVIGLMAMPINKENSSGIKNFYTHEVFIEETDFNNFYFNDYCQGGFSVLVFNREMWLSCLSSDDFLLTQWVYYIPVIKILTKTKKKLLFINKPTVLTGQDCRWAKRNGAELFTFTASNILFEKMIDFGFDKERMLRFIHKNSKKIIIILLRAKGNGLKINLENIAFIYKNSKFINIPTLILVTTIYFIPNQIVALARDIRKKIIQ